MGAKNPGVSLVILTYNGIDDARKLLPSIQAQTIAPEIIVIDSQSADGTAQYFASQGVQVHTIDKKDFNHGGTRNLGLKLAGNEIVAFVTQDVIFDNNDSLELLVKALKGDDSIAMSFGRQLAKPGATVLSEFARLNNYPDQSIVKSQAATAYLGIKNCFISNSFAAYKRSIVEQLGGFPSHLIMCEDVFVGGQALLKGYKIAYVAGARVFHSHNYTIGEEFRRYFDIGHFYNSENWILKNFSEAESEGLSYLRKEIGYISKRKKLWLIPQFIIRTFAKYTGYKLGKYHSVLPIGLKRMISMHSYHWKDEQKPVRSI